MTTAVAALPATAPLAPPASVLEQASANRPFSSMAPSGAGALPTSTPQRTASSKSTNSHSPPTIHEPQLRRTTSDGKRSPPSASTSRVAQIPKVFVKKEPTSPDLPTGRHRPSRLNLASSNMTNGAAAPAGALSARPSAGPLTSRDSAGLHLHEIGVACLSPGFNTQDPTMREQMERAMNIREQQRRLIENRQKGKTGGNGAAPAESDNAFGRPTKTPMTSRRKGPPPGLSIAAPPAEAFANERVIQSAPLHASFPRHHMHPSTRHGPPSNLSSIHHAPAHQTVNRLPPIADVFPEVQQQPAGPPRGPHYQSPGTSSHANQPPLPSPSYPPHTAQFPPSGLVSRPREHKSAEEALKELTGGRDDLLPRIVHYGGHQPPTPPSPKAVGLGVTTAGAHSSSLADVHRSGSSRRRDRDEYERDNGTPPLGRGPLPTRRSGPFGEGTDSPAEQRQKKEEFMTLVSRAWDLWHS